MFIRNHFPCKPAVICLRHVITGGSRCSRHETWASSAPLKDYFWPTLKVKIVVYSSRVPVSCFKRCMTLSVKPGFVCFVFELTCAQPLGPWVIEVIPNGQGVAGLIGGHWLSCSSGRWEAEGPMLLSSFRGSGLWLWTPLGGGTESGQRVRWASWDLEPKVFRPSSHSPLLCCFCLYPLSKVPLSLEDNLAIS